MGNLNYGKHTYGNLIRRGNMNNITVGSFCSIAVNVVVDSGFNHNPKWISTYPFNSNLQYGVPHNVICKGDITIGSDVWIGEDTMIMSGVNIGHGSIVGARSIITKDIEPYSMVVGAGRFVKKRFSDNQIESLLNIKWWEWEDEKIEEAAPLLMSENIDDFINKYKVQ